MSFKWSKEILENIVLTKEMESNTLEFKSGDDLNEVMKSNNNKKNTEFSKDISAMANSNGGDIIYGISEEKKSDKSVAGSFSFVERNFLIDSIEQKLNSLIIPKIDNIEIIPIDFSETEMVVIISIPKSYTAHQAKDKKYYKRFGFSVEPMEDWEVKDIINRGLKPEVELIFSAVKDNNYLSINNITYGCYDINIKVHNKGKVSANYLDYLRKQAETHLKESSSVFVSTFIDYYGLYEKYNFPKWEEGNKIYDINNRILFLEEAMKEDISESLQHRFIPYLQLHEFEALLFIDLQMFYEQVPKSDLVGIDELKETFAKYSNPEMINNSKNTSPGHRLERIIKGYKKPLYGHYLAEAIGIQRIRTKCPRFDNWITTLISIS